MNNADHPERTSRPKPPHFRIETLVPKSSSPLSQTPKRNLPLKLSLHPVQKDVTATSIDLSQGEPGTPVSYIGHIDVEKFKRDQSNKKGFIDFF